MALLITTTPLHTNPVDLYNLGAMISIPRLASESAFDLFQSSMKEIAKLKKKVTGEQECLANISGTAIDYDKIMPLSVALVCEAWRLFVGWEDPSWDTLYVTLLQAKTGKAMLSTSWTHSFINISISLLSHWRFRFFMIFRKKTSHLGLGTKSFALPILMCTLNHPALLVFGVAYVLAHFTSLAS